MKEVVNELINLLDTNNKNNYYGGEGASVVGAST